jgi:2-polyprenyl-6-methoxyphenol hydroxylase-like FAD-dependent oxidoreductase
VPLVLSWILSGGGGISTGADAEADLETCAIHGGERLQRRKSSVYSLERCPTEAEVMPGKTTSGTAGEGDAELLPVLVVGAGPVGLTAACELLRRGIPCRIVDRNEGPTPLHESRALVLWERTLEVFRDMGVVARISSRGREVQALNLFAGGRRILRLGLGLDDSETRYRFPLTIPQGETERVLEERLVELGGRVERRTRLLALEQDAGGATATLVHPDHAVEELRAEWIVGCDGAWSTVRTLLTIPFEGTEYPERFLLADLRVGWDAPEDEARVFLQPEGGAFAAFPLPQKGCWRFIDATGSGPEERGEVLSRFRSLLQESGQAEAGISEMFWTSSFRIHRRVAGRFRIGRCFLAGDAAHIHSPVGGQGMNTGIQDAYNLAWKLALAVSGECGNRLLDSYEAERMPVALDVLRATDLATRGVMLHNRMAEKVRVRAIGILGRRESALEKIRRRLSEIDVGYRGSPIVGGATTGRGAPAPGDRAPDAVVRESGKTKVRLLDFLTGDSQQLLLFTGGSPTAEEIGLLQHAATLISNRYRGKVSLKLVQHPDVPHFPREEEGTIHDENGALHRRFFAVTGTLLLVRPDGYIGYREDAGRGGIEVYLDRLFS